MSKAIKVIYFQALSPFYLTFLVFLFFLIFDLFIFPVSLTGKHQRIMKLLAGRYIDI